jgi:1,4-dihydroxy-6-naphthoate synthase
VSKNFDRLEQLQGRRVGVGGIPTTGWFLLQWLCPESVAVSMPFDKIGDAIARGELDAGVMIHEELLYYPKLGLQKVMDLGAEWCQRTGFPLPVGLNVVRRDLGRTALERICHAIRSSLEFGLEHRDEALDWVSRFGRGKEGQCTRQFVEMFANADSLHMPPDVRDSLQLLLKAVVDLGVGTSVPALDIVEGTFIPGHAAKKRQRREHTKD